MRWKCRGSSEKLLARETGIGLMDWFYASKFPTRFGFTMDGYTDRKNDQRLDDCLHYCIVAGKKVLEDADIGSDKCSKVCCSIEFQSFFMLGSDCYLGNLNCMNGIWWMCVDLGDIKKLKIYEELK